MSEEEILKVCKDLISMTDYKFQCNYTIKERNQAIQGLLDLYKKQNKQKYVSKDELKKVLIDIDKFDTQYEISIYLQKAIEKILGKD